MTIEELARKYNLNDAHRHAIETLISLGHTIEEFDRDFAKAIADESDPDIDLRGAMAAARPNTAQGEAKR